MECSHEFISTDRQVTTCVACNKEVKGRWQYPRGKILEYHLHRHILIMELKDKFGLKERTYIQIPIFEFFSRERGIKDFVSCQQYIVDLLRFSIKLPSVYRNFGEDNFGSAISRAVERGYKESLIALCEYAQSAKIESQSLYLLRKYKISEELYDIASKYDWKDLSFEGKEDTSSLNLNEYLGYRFTYHTFYYLKERVNTRSEGLKKRTEQMLEYWSRMKYRNCTVGAILDLYKTKDELVAAGRLLDSLRTLNLCRDLEADTFIFKYWQKGHNIEEWMFF